MKRRTESNSSALVDLYDILRDRKTKLARKKGKTQQTHEREQWKRKRQHIEGIQYCRVRTAGTTMESGGRIKKFPSSDTGRVISTQVSAAIFDSEQQEARPVPALMQRVSVSNRTVTTRKSVSSVLESIRGPSWSQASNISERQGLLVLLYTNSRKMYEVKKCGWCQEESSPTVNKTKWLCWDGECWEEIWKGSRWTSSRI